MANTNLSITIGNPKIKKSKPATPASYRDRNGCLGDTRSPVFLNSLHNSFLHHLDLLSSSARRIDAGFSGSFTAGNRVPSSPSLLHGKFASI